MNSLRRRLGEIAWLRGSVYQLITQSANSPASRSLAIPLFFSFLIFVTAYAFPEENIEGISLHFADLLNAVGSFSIFLLAKIKTRRRNIFPLLSGFFLWLIASIFSLFLPLIVFTIITKTLSFDLIALTISGLVSYPVLMCFIGVVTSSAINSQQELRALASQKNELKLKQATLDADVAYFQAELNDVIAAEIQQIYRKFETTLGNGDFSSVRNSAVELRESIDDVIRPLSLHLAYGSFPNEVYATSPTSESEHLHSFLTPEVLLSQHRKFAISAIVSPPLIFILAAVFLLPAMYHSDGIFGVIQSALALLAVTALSLFSLLTWGNISAGPAKTIFFATGIYGMGALLLGSFLQLLGDTQTAYGPAAIAVCIALSTLATTTVLYFALNRTFVISELSDTNTATEIYNSRRRQEFWAVKQQLARVVHGTIQTKLLSTSIKLSQNEDLDSESISQTHTELREALEALHSSQEGFMESFDTHLDRLIQSWDGVCEISFSIAQSVISELDQDTVAKMCVTEVLTEVIANAAKHSKSHSAIVQIEIQNENYFRILIQVPGRLENSVGNPGLGTKVLNEVTSTWSRINIPGFIVFDALVSRETRLENLE